MWIDTIAKKYARGTPDSYDMRGNICFIKPIGYS